MRRISVVGNSGSGKTHLGQRLAALLDVPHVELDALYHLAGWEPSDPAEFLATVEDVASTDAWVIDGNYRAVVVDGPVWRRADTVVWLDLARRSVMRQVIGRTVRRLVSREELWNGNREPIRNVLSWSPDRSIIRWAWTQHGTYVDRYRTAMTSSGFAHLDFVRLHSRDQADAWLDAARRPEFPDAR